MVRNLQTRPRILIICGPTATGKTDLALKLAANFNGELISADSRQVYSEMDIGTGKAPATFKTLKKQKDKWLVDGIPIYLYDVATPAEQFTVFRYHSLVWQTLAKIWAKKKLPILVGGTGFYIKAVVSGIKTLGIPPDFKLRKQLETKNLAKLQEILKDLNPQKMAKMHQSDQKNPRRLIRAIEISQAERPPALPACAPPKLRQRRAGRLNPILIGLTAPRKILYQKIDRRFEKRLEIGLINEVRKLAKKTGFARLDQFGLEYRYCGRYLQGLISREEMVEKIKTAIHDAARRQLTWFESDRRILWYNITELGFEQKVEKRVRKWLNNLRYAAKN